MLRPTQRLTPRQREPCRSVRPPSESELDGGVGVGSFGLVLGVLPALLLNG
jgi:hypothetical protein